MPTKKHKKKQLERQEPERTHDCHHCQTIFTCRWVTSGPRVSYWGSMMTYPQCFCSKIGSPIKHYCPQCEYLLPS